MCREGGTDLKALKSMHLLEPNVSLPKTATEHVLRDRARTSVPIVHTAQGGNQSA
jgi:hypothetical protein